MGVSPPSSSAFSGAIYPEKTFKPFNQEFVLNDIACQKGLWFCIQINGSNTFSLRFCTLCILRHKLSYKPWVMP